MTQDRLANEDIFDAHGKPGTPAGPLIDTRERHTIMDGKVVTFARAFSTRDGATGPIHEAVGPWKISASRNAVVVHKAEIRNRSELAAFLAALKMAGHMAVDLARTDKGNYDPR